MRDQLASQVQTYLHKLCLEIPNRRVGSQGNRAATAFFAETVASFGFAVEMPPFDCFDWEHGELGCTAGGEAFTVFASPYSLGCRVQAPLVIATSVAELEKREAAGKLLLLRGEIAREQLMPKNFPFYNPEGHQHIVSLLEAKAPAAVLAATGSNPELAGGMVPFPLIEDGDFDIPSVYMTEAEGERLAAHAGKLVALHVDARRIPATGSNVIARKAGRDAGKVVVCAHIDSKIGTPGALDNAAGVAVLLLLAELLDDYTGGPAVELLAFNGEDYYAAPGQIQYLAQHGSELDRIDLAINIDGAGYRHGNTAYSLYGCPPQLAGAIHAAFAVQEGMGEGEPWYQGDHAIFVLHGVPALGITSERAVELFTEITHTRKDLPELVAGDKLARIALALDDLIRKIDLSRV